MDYENRVLDARYRAMWRGLTQLSSVGIGQILAQLDRGDAIVLDHVNFDKECNSWCPLAIGLGVPRILKEKGIRCLSDRQGKQLILNIGRSYRGDFSLNPLSGIQGEFFTVCRSNDLRMICQDILTLRGAKHCARS